MTSYRLPVLFVGHGNPMNALGNSEYAAGWRSMVEDIPRPDAILCISAHWETWGTGVSTNPHPVTIHDFYGFPEELYQIQYPCPGSPDFAHEAAQGIRKTEVSFDRQRGLDHGAWAVIIHMYPGADIPVFQLSLDASKLPRFHYELADEISHLRDRDVLVIGSGNLVHNLYEADFGGDRDPFDWAIAFDRKVRDLIVDADHETLVDYERLGEEARLSIPSNEHYLPLLYVLGMRKKEEPVAFFNERIVMRSVSMRSLRIG